MRQGEILALKWDCVDFGAGTVRVKRTMWKGEVYPPKTLYSRRTIKLSRLALRALWDHRQRQTAGSEWCFPNRAGKPMDCHHFPPLEGLVKAAGLRANLRFHDLRHTCATLLLTEGVHPKIVQELLGHSTIFITLGCHPRDRAEAHRTARA